MGISIEIFKKSGLIFSSKSGSKYYVVLWSDRIGIRGLAGFQ